MILSDQIEMRYDVSVDPVPTATVEQVEKMVAFLRIDRRLTALELAAKLGLPLTENSKRRVRAIARAARPGIVSFPNSAGYQLLATCTLEELNECISAWDSVIRDATASKALFLTALHSRSSATR